MSLIHSPSITLTGLVFYYDYLNTKKSWKGQPATNLVANPYSNHNGSNFVFTDHSVTTGGATYTLRTGVANPVDSPTVMEYYTGTTAYKYWAIKTTVPSTGTYTFSYYARLVGGADGNFGNSQLWRDDGILDRTPTGDWNPSMTHEWKRFVAYATVTTSLNFFAVHSGAVTGGYTIQYCGFQLESGSYATPFVNGARSVTQSVIDLTGNTVPDVTACTYDGSGNITFNASSSYIKIPNSTLLDNQTITMESWCNPTVTSQSGFLFEKGSVNSQYSMFFETGGTFYFRTIGISTQDLTFTTATYVTAGTWNHIVCTYGTGTKTCYVNGVQVAQQTGLTGTISTNSSGMSIGAYGGYSGAHSYYFNGSIGTTKVYNKALTPGEVKQNFDATRGRYGI